MIIVKNRELLIPNNERYIGTTYDNDTENRVFQVPRFSQRGVDLANLTFRLDIQYANESYDTVVLDKEVGEDFVILIWRITSSTLQVPGTLYIGLRAIDDEATVKWSSFSAAMYAERHLNTPGNYGGSLTEIEQMEQDHQYMKNVINELKDNLDYAHDAEAWAQGTRSGAAVPSTDKTYHKNSKYYADQANTNATAAANSATQAAETVSDTNTRFNNAMAAVTDETEVIDARVGADGTTYPVLKTRLDTEHTQLKSALINNLKYLNSYNYLTDYSWQTYGSGVNVSRSGDGGINLAGTASGQYFVNFYSDTTRMPQNLTPGKTYTAIFSGQNVVFNVYFYKNGSYLYGLDITATRQFTIPSNATGAAIRLKVNSGITVNETVYPFIVDNTSLLYKGTIKNDLDIGTIKETGIYLLTGNASSPAPYGTLIHLEASDFVRVQIMFELADLKIWYRRCLSGTWYSWQTYGDAGFYNKSEYIAFGDSLMYGALWNGTADNPVITQAPLGSRIPDRIKNAIKCYTYRNYAVGGMAYTIENGSIPKFIDWIKSKDISTADLITIAGGRNDGSSQLGTSASASGDGTICGAIREIIEYIREVNPACQIVVIQVTPYTSTNNPWTSTSSSGWTLNSFDEQVSQLCKDMNVGYASWYGCSMFSKWSDFSGGGGNWAHMKDEAQYIQMGNFIAGQVAKYYQN